MLASHADIFVRALLELTLSTVGQDEQKELGQPRFVLVRAAAVQEGGRHNHRHGVPEEERPELLQKGGWVVVIADEALPLLRFSTI